ncbi:MAG: 30S ribosomal protein S1 [Alphaproteobacteria bacterium]|nr:30S ribosomal protein S1 [Alphaproteobacteria bacterium]
MNTSPETQDPGSAMSDDDFAALLDDGFDQKRGYEGRVVKGTVIAVENDFALIDVGLKSEGRVPLREFSAPGLRSEIKIGDMVEVYVERFEDRNGEALLSRERARREEAWTQLERAFKDNQRVTGVIFGRVKGGFTVDLSGAVAFLPGSQVDIRPVRDITPLMNQEQPFQILKMDRQRGNIVVSRRAVLEETRAEARAELISNLKEGQVLTGIVKNITDYGAFVDLGGVDGLLHVTDIAWRRINHPSEALQIGQSVQVQVIRFNPETQRISLGMKQLEADPWDGVVQKYPISTKLKGRVTNITDYGAFVELEPGIEGLVHVSEMSWTKKNVHPGKIVSTSQEVEVMVLEVDSEKRRISLGIKQCQENPWAEFADRFAVGSELEGEIKNITEFGLFIGLPGDIDGMVHLSDLSWGKSGDEAISGFTKGEMVKFKVLDVDLEKERISLGIKQLSDDPFTSTTANIKKNDIVTCTVSEVTPAGIEVSLGDGATGFIRKSDLSRDRSEQRPDRFAVGEKVDAVVSSVDQSTRRITLSIKAKEVREEKEAMAQYGSSDSGASLGDILGAALSKASENRETPESEEPTETEATDDAAEKAAPEAASDDTAPADASDEAKDAPEEAADTPEEASDGPEDAEDAPDEPKDA